MLGLKEVSPEREQKVLAELEEAAKLHPPFLVLTASSAIIAAFGLLLNSPAVVIGAMLVAPLMTPIFSLSVALIRGRAALLRQAVATEAYGVGLAVLLALIIGLIVPEPELTSEILARTQPTLFDLAVALAAGLAGAFAMVREEVSPALPGVAIAVALLPPLATVGLGISMRRWDVAGGAFVLFLANFVAIHLVGAVVFYLSGLASHIMERNPRVLLRSFGFTLAVLAVMVVFLSVQLRRIVHQERDARTAQQTLEQQVRMVRGAALSGTDVRCGEMKCAIVATVETPQVFEPPLVEAIQNVVEDRMQHKVDLTIRSVLTSEATASGYRYHEERPAEEPKPVTPAQPEATPAERVRNLLAEQAKMVPGSKLVDSNYDPTAQPPKVVATYLTTAPFPEPLERGIANLLSGQLGQEVALEIHYVGPLPGNQQGKAEDKAAETKKKPSRK
ncbi:MAG TPA: TIGR00341 family protein [Candidatus Acidoferrales bacterium]|nr:TIGR00341 family protein [Candidatus Acidoferrales bacterium]